LAGAFFKKGIIMHWLLAIQLFCGFGANRELNGSAICEQKFKSCVEVISQNKDFMALGKMESKDDIALWIETTSKANRRKFCGLNK